MKLLAGFMAFGGMAIAHVAQAQTAAPAAAPAAPADAAAATAGSKAGNTMNEIVVVGNRYQAARAQIKATNTQNILSADDLSHTAVHNVAEALALLPGISTTNTGTGFVGGVDAAARGEALFAQVRGLDTAYEINLMDGVNVAEANPYTRAIQLNVLPPSGLSTIVLNLTATPDQEADFVSGLIDYHTPSAFDFGPTHFELTLGAKLESQALAYGNNTPGDNFAIDGSKRFGSNDQFGVYAGLYYDTRNFVNTKVGGINESGGGDYGWGYTIQGPGPGNNSAPGFTPVDNITLAGVNESVATGSTQRYGGTLALDWRPNDTTSFFFRGTTARAYSQESVVNTQIIGQGNYGYGQNGKGVGSLGNPVGTTGNYQFTIPDVSERYWFLTYPQLNTINTVQVGGQSKFFGHLTVSGSVFASSGVDNQPNQIQIAARNLDNGGAGTTFGGTQLFGTTQYDGVTVPTNLLNAYQKGVLNNYSAFIPVNAPELTTYYSQENLAGVKGDLKYDFDEGYLKYVKIGGKIMDAWHADSSVDYQIGGSTTGGAEPASIYPTLGSLNLFSKVYSSVIPGLYTQPIPIISVSALQALYRTQAADPAIGVVADNCGGFAPNNLQCNTTRTREEYASGYAMADFQVGQLEVIPGIRVENTHITNTYFNIPINSSSTSPGYFQTDGKTERVFLPSIAFNYRTDSRTVYRFSIWDSYVRPPFAELANTANYSQTNEINPQGQSVPVIVIQKGNPNLKPILATNFDFSAEWDSGAGGHLMLQSYYKQLRGYIYDSGSGANNFIPGPFGLTQTKVPVNGGDASVLGFDIEARQKFQGLPEPFDGLGVWGNFTRQYTGVNLGDTYGAHTGFKDAMADTPGVLANVGVFYQKGPYSLDINYNYQGAAVQGYDQFGLGNSSDDVWTSPVGRLDLHAGYQFQHNFHLDFAVSNLTNACSYYAHVGKNTDTEMDAVFSGVTGAINLSYKY
jgi:TonB-dependent receptor